MGSFIAEELCNDFEVTVVDNNKSTLNQIEERNHRISAINFDVKNGIIEDIIANYDLAVNCLPGFMGFEMLKKIIQCKVSCVDISFMPENCLAGGRGSRTHLPRSSRGITDFKSGIDLFTNVH